MNDLLIISSCLIESEIQELELKNKKFFIRDLFFLSLFLSIVRIRTSAGTSFKKKMWIPPLWFFLFPLTFPSLILDSFYRYATIRFDFKPDRDFLILASSVQCENENERLPFSTSPISSIVRPFWRNKETRRENWNACISARIWSFLLFLFSFFFSFFFKVHLHIST